ncbi:hypothetical protein Tco_0906658 [Tanacetum coccineum]|uniref:Uncharacterized protein n=1 Tax=Tanacetum coccineum TaxID=301880 RepID=A0ABQ5CKB0_9ASTR
MDTEPIIGTSYMQLILQPRTTCHLQSIISSATCHHLSGGLSTVSAAITRAIAGPPVNGGQRRSMVANDGQRLPRGSQVASMWCHVVADVAEGINPHAGLKHETLWHTSVVEESEKEVNSDLLSDARSRPGPTKSDHRVCVYWSRERFAMWYMCITIEMCSLGSGRVRCGNVCNPDKDGCMVKEFFS